MGLFDDVSEKHLRAVLVALCKDIDIFNRAFDMIDKLETAEEDAMADSDMSESEPKLAICIRCESAFSIDENEDYDCSYHPDGLFPDQDHMAWNDHDLDSHGPLDTRANRKAHPDAFRWDCCDEVTAAEGCELGRHRIEPGEESDSD